MIEIAVDVAFPDGIIGGYLFLGNMVYTVSFAEAQIQIPLGSTRHDTLYCWRILAQEDLLCATSLVVSRRVEDCLCKIVSYSHSVFSLFIFQA